MCGGTATPFEQTVRPLVKQCFFDTVASHPAASGKVTVTINLDPKGKVMKINLAEEKELGKDAVACIRKVFDAQKLDGSRCAGKSVSLAMAFGKAAK